MSLSGIPEGTHYIELVAIPYNPILESDNSNNSRGGTFVWKGVPDLVATYFNSFNGSNFITGQPVEFMFTVENLGTGKADGTIYNYLDVNDEGIGSIAIPALDVGYMATVRFTLTFGAPMEICGVGVHVNKYNSIIESNTNNNYKTKVIAVVSASAFLSYGWPNVVIPIKPYSYNNTWQSPMDASISNWNNAGAKITFNKDSTSNNTIIVDSYADSWLGLNTGTHSGSQLTRFVIQLNSRTINLNATNFSNFVTSVFVHELGHSIWLADNPDTTCETIMSYYRDRNTMTQPQVYDIRNVQLKY